MIREHNDKIDNDSWENEELLPASGKPQTNLQLYFIYAS